MKINITLTDNLVEQILSEHFKRKLGEDVEISFVRESAKPVDAYSEWYTVPENHKVPNCPIELQPEQQIDVILKNGKKNRYFISDVKRSWIQECHPLDIKQFRIVNPKDDWLIVPSNHLNENCPIALPTSQMIEVEIADDEYLLQTITNQSQSFYLWPQDKKGSKIVKFRLAK